MLTAITVDPLNTKCMGIVNVAVGRYVGMIGELAFNDIEMLTAITVDPLNTKYSSKDGVLFNKDGSTLIQFPASMPISEYIMYDSVNSISKYAFLNAFRLTNVKFKSTSSLTIVMEGAFYGCNGLASITLPEGVKNIGARAFYNCNSMTNIRMLRLAPPVLGEDVFFNSPINAIFVKDTNALTNYQQASDATGWTAELKAKLFEYTERTPEGFLIKDNIIINYSGEGGDLVIPDTVVGIAENVFRNQPITGVSGGNNITSIGASAFLGTEWLDKINSTVSLGSVLIRHSDAETIIMNDSITEIYDGAFTVLAG